MAIRVLIADNDLGDSRLETTILETAIGAEVHVASCRSEDDVLAAVDDVRPEALIVQWAPITERVLEAAAELAVISRVGIGTDMIDVSAATSRGIPVMNVPHYCTEEVATHAVALGLSLWRRLPQFDRELRDGRWNAASSAPLVRRLSESTVGLIGLGRIGRLVATAYAALGATVLAHDPLAGDDPYRRVSLDELADKSDLISLHAPLLPATHHVVDAEFLERCVRTPVIVNTSRGQLIDQPALVAALESGRIAGAGLDVFDAEPLPADDPIRRAPDTILTPHASWCSVSALPELRREAAMNIVRHFS